MSQPTLAKENQHLVQFNCGKTASALIDLIVKRAIAFGRENNIQVDAESLAMDITACHCNGCPLDLEKLLTAPEVHFGHDVFGIRRHIDRNTGKVERFLPRCAKPERRRAIGAAVQSSRSKPCRLKPSKSSTSATR